MIERESEHIPYDLSNEDVVTHILESGSPEEIEQVREFLHLTVEQVNLFSQFAKQRKQTLEQMRDAYETRKLQNPTPTSDELSLGFYIEKIEPQVRSAVVSLRQKGYSTYESGYGDYDGQRISFREKHLDNFQFPEEFPRSLEQKGISVTVKPNSISFTCARYVEMDELQNIWDQIERVLPDLGKPAELNMSPAAQSFRSQVNK